jgi:hypothetical protein
LGLLLFATQLRGLTRPFCNHSQLLQALAKIKNCLEWLRQIATTLSGYLGAQFIAPECVNNGMSSTVSGINVVVIVVVVCCSVRELEFVA